MAFARACAAGTCGWAGWSIVPMLFWTVSGFVMVARPIAEVRGTDLAARARAACARRARRSRRALTGLPVASLTLEPRAAGPRWVIQLAGDPPRSRLADPATGRLLPPLRRGRGAARSAVALHRHARVAAVTRVDRGQSADRTPPPARRVAGADGRRDAFLRRCRVGRDRRAADALLAPLRLHVGAPHHGPAGAQQTNNPWVVTFALLALVMTLMALVLLPLATRKGSRIKPPSSFHHATRLATRRDRRARAGSRGSAPGCSARP